MEKGPVIRRLRHADIDQFQYLYTAVLSELHHDNPEASESYKKQYSVERLRLLLDDPLACLVVADIEARVLGFGVGRIAGGVGLIHWMGVDPDYRTRGIGTVIGQYMIEEYKRKGCHKVELYTYLESPHLIKLYKNWGFRESAVLKNHYYHLNVVYMTKELV